jgi:hypothetical protein
MVKGQSRPRTLPGAAAKAEVDLKGEVESSILSSSTIPVAILAGYPG